MMLVLPLAALAVAGAPATGKADDAEEGNGGDEGGGSDAGGKEQLLGEGDGGNDGGDRGDGGRPSLDQDDREAGIAASQEAGLALDEGNLLPPPPTAVGSISGEWINEDGVNGGWNCSMFVGGDWLFGA